MRRLSKRAFTFALLAGAAVHAQSSVAAPAGAGQHFAPPAAGPGAILRDDLERALWQGVQAAAQAAGVPPPSLDHRLVGVARDLADVWRDGAQPGIELQEHLLSAHGLGDPLPVVVGLRLMVTDAAVRERLGQIASGLMAQRGGFDRVGIAVHRRFWNKSVVIALQRTYAEMLPVPRQLPLTGSALVAGRLLRNMRDPRAWWAPPIGDVRTLPLQTSRDSFQTTFRCEGLRGRHQVEIMGAGGSGPTVLVNFPVWCGTEVPTIAPPFDAGGPETLDARQGERLALDRLNQDRAAVGIAPVQWDEALARVARSHSQAMAGRHRVAHVLPGSGNAADRLRAAGVAAAVVLENVARASSIAEAQRSFMSSPAHRANVLNRDARRVGIGVIVEAELGGARTVYVTQLLTP